jgi:hypothetical protein
MSIYNNKCIQIDNLVQDMKNAKSRLESGISQTGSGSVSHCAAPFGIFTDERQDDTKAQENFAPVNRISQRDHSV